MGGRGVQMGHSYISIDSNDYLLSEFSEKTLSGTWLFWFKVMTPRIQNGFNTYIVSKAYILENMFRQLFRHSYVHFKFNRFFYLANPHL